MINVSNEFRQLMGIRTDFKENAEITFADGTFLELSEKDFTISNNSVVDAAESNGIPLGVALCRNIQIELMNDDGKFSDYDFYGAVIRLYLTFQLSETVERIEYGTFTVLTPETYGETIIISALDDMYKANRQYTTNLTFPATIKAILVDGCDSVGISLGSVSFKNDDFVVDSMPDGITFRQLFGYIAMIAGGNARIDRTGRLQIISYDFPAMDEMYGSIISGGKYRPWNNPVDVSGGTFNPWTEGDSVSGGHFGDRKNIHVLTMWSNSPQVDTDDVYISGIQTSRTVENKEEILLYGTEGYVLQVDNPLIEGKESEALALIGSVMVGGKFRQFSGDLISDPTIEFMDPALVVDRKGNVYVSFVTDITFQFFGFTSIKNSAAPVIRNNSSYSSDATKTLVAARKMVEKERTSREKAIERLAKDLANSSGLFATEEVQPDGSTIYYMHDKPTLEESMIIWKLTSLAFGISTDGGETYPYGFTINGEIIAKLLYAEGINADYIDSGAIKISDSAGNILFYADYDTNKVEINASNVKIGSENIADAITDVKTELNLQAGQIEARVEKDGVIGAINLTHEEAVILAKRIDLQGLVKATEFTTKFATISSLNTVNARVSIIESDYITTKELDAEIAYVKKIFANYVTISNLYAVNARVSRIESDYITTKELDAEIAYVENLFANYATISNLDAVNARVSSIESDYITTKELYAEIAYVENLFANYATISNLNAVNARVSSIQADYASADWVEANFFTADEVRAEFATISELEAVEGRFNHIDAGSITTGTMSADRIDADSLGGKVVTVLSGKSVYVASLNASSILNANGGLTVNGYDVSRKSANIGGVTINYWGWD